jgi:alkaline phosphatase D
MHSPDRRAEVAGLLLHHPQPIVTADENVRADLRADAVTGAEILVDPDHQSGCHEVEDMRDDPGVLPPDLDRADVVTVLQLSDTHLSAPAGLPASLRWLLSAVAAQPPDLIALTGDIVYEDPDDIDDRSFARAVFADLPCPLVTIPGNHDVGFYGDDDLRPKRLAAFLDTWGRDRFAVDAAGWRLVGANAYLLGDPEHDDWLRGAVGVGRPVAVFIHQPVVDETADGWEMPPTATAAFGVAVDGADVRLVASGHRHRYADRGRDVWVPSTTIPGEQRDGWSDPRLGAVEFTFRRDGTLAHRLLHPPVHPSVSC